MISPDTKLSCRLDRTPESEAEHQRLQTLVDLNLLEAESIPIFEEATQTAAHFLDAPICTLAVLDRDRLLLKSAIGLFRMGLMNELASSRQLPRHESFCTHVVDSQQTFIVDDATANDVLAETVLVKRYGIRSYLGVPLIASNGQCLGTLAVMTLSPRTFTTKEAETLQLIARWSISEFERDRMLKQPASQAYPDVKPIPEPSLSDPLSVASVKAQLMTQMTQELCTPLTSILGMARVVSQGIYGTLTDKQREYIEIIHNSGQYLRALINEVLELGALDDTSDALNLGPIDIEMLCQQAVNTLSQAAQRHDQEIQLTVEPGSRIWVLDKDKVRQMLYHLIFSVMQSSNPNSTIRLHISRKSNHLNLLVWISHPWLGDGLPQMDLAARQVLPTLEANELRQSRHTSTLADPEEDVTRSSLQAIDLKNGSRQSLGLMLSRRLAELHGGSITIQGSLEEGHRYVIKLPQLRYGENEA